MKRSRFAWKSGPSPPAGGGETVRKERFFKERKLKRILGSVLVVLVIALVAGLAGTRATEAQQAATPTPVPPAAPADMVDWACLNDKLNEDLKFFPLGGATSTLIFDGDSREGMDSFNNPVDCFKPVATGANNNIGGADVVLIDLVSSDGNVLSAAAGSPAKVRGNDFGEATLTFVLEQVREVDSNNNAVDPTKYRAISDLKLRVTYNKDNPRVNINIPEGLSGNVVTGEGTQEKPFTFVIQNTHEGNIGRLRVGLGDNPDPLPDGEPFPTDFSGRNLVFGLQDGVDVQSFRIWTDYDSQFESDGMDPPMMVPSFETHGVLAVADGANLEVRNYNFIVNANDVVGFNDLGDEDASNDVQPGRSDAKYVRVTVTQGNRAPVAPPRVAVPVAEGTANGTVVYDLGAVVTDADNQLLTYSVQGNPTDLPFAVNQSNGKITLTETNKLDFEENQSDFPGSRKVWVFNIVVDDGAEQVVSEITVTVTDVEPDPTEPEVVAGDEFTIAEDLGAAEAQDIGTVEFTDSGDFRNHLLRGAGANLFTINEDLELKTAPGASFDHETAPRYQFNLQSQPIAGGRDETTIITVNVTNVDEAPRFGELNRTTGEFFIDVQRDAQGNPTTPRTPVDYSMPIRRIAETARPGDVVNVVTLSTQGVPIIAPVIVADDEDAGEVAVFSLETVPEDDEEKGVAYTGPFAIDAMSGQLTVAGQLDADAAGSGTHEIVVVAADAQDADLRATATLTITVVQANEGPEFVNPQLSIDVDEGTAAPTVLATYTATDDDGDSLEYRFRNEVAVTAFAMDGRTGELSVRDTDGLDFETQPTHALEIVVDDNKGGIDNIRVIVNVNDLDDHAPTIAGDTTINVNENTARGHLLETYMASDADAVSTVTLSLAGADADKFSINQSGQLRTVAALDYETDNTHSVTVVASDGVNANATRDVTITVTNVDDANSFLSVSVANPVPGTQGAPRSALADAKQTLAGQTAVLESPADLPVTESSRGAGPFRFVSTDAVNWNSVVRLSVTTPSAESTCDDGRCIFIQLLSDSAEDALRLKAYRSTSADNTYIAAFTPVLTDGTPSGESNSVAVYKHTNGEVARLEVDEDDTIEIKFRDLVRDSITVENEPPEITEFAPEHETSLDKNEVDYSFTVTDGGSGIPEPDEGAFDADDDYFAVVALISSTQCVEDVRAGYRAIPGLRLHDGDDTPNSIYCRNPGSVAMRLPSDENDFDEVTDGFEVDTTLVLDDNRTSYVTFVVCDAAGNCTAHNPDQNDADEALAEITIDSQAPDLVEARTGVRWDSSDNDYDDNRSYIQVIFNDASKLNGDSVEADDFVVEGHSIVSAQWFDVDADDDDWADSPSSFAGSDPNGRYRQVSRSVFLELDGELDPDEEPDVSVVPNGVEDTAGNEQDDDEVEADDWIAPGFSIVSVDSSLTTSDDALLSGDDQTITVVVSADERLTTPKPNVQVTYVNAPAGCVYRGKILLSDEDNKDDNGNDLDDAHCATSADGGTLSTTISKTGTSEWSIAIGEPESTGYYSVYISGDDKSAQTNSGSVGIAVSDLQDDFFERDGDVNAGDAVFFQGDLNLPDPDVIVSGVRAGDSQPDIEIKSPLFVEIDFTTAFVECDEDDGQCVSETSEYFEDGFDTVTVTMFDLNGVDLTENVRTTDNETFLVSLADVTLGDHKITIQAEDQAGNELDDALEIEFTLEERDAFSRRLSPGWNLVSLPGEPADNAIGSVFGSDIDVRTVYTYDPVVPGGWLVAVRETVDGDWKGDLTEVSARRGYWVLSEAIQDLEVVIPRIVGGAAGASTPVQPPVIPLYAGWNLIPVIDVSGDALGTDKAINAETYLNSLDDGIDLARVLGFNSITGEWFTVLDEGVSSDLQIGSAYWVFVRESATLVPGGIPR